MTAEELANELFIEPTALQIEPIKRFGAECERRGMERAAKLVDGYRMVSASLIGPLHGAGWNDAIKHTGNFLRKEALKTP